MDDSTSHSVYASRGASYGKLFPGQLADKCSPDALESNTGLLAYLHALHQQALALEELSNKNVKATLSDRRPDLGALTLDKASLEQQIPALTLVIHALTHQAQQYVSDKNDLIKVISEAKYPAGLPYHAPQEGIKAVLRQKNQALFDVLQQSTYTFPNFSYAELRTEPLRQVMRNAAGFSPSLQALLLANSSKDKDYFLKCYGVEGSAKSALEKLCSVEFLCRQTGLKIESVQDLLATSGVADEATEAFTSVRSRSAYLPLNAEADSPLAGHLFGAAFINNTTAPALTLEDTHKGAGISLRIKGATIDHLDRIHKIIHLQHALQLSFDDVDLLVMSALRAEGQTKDFHFTENSLRALGVFSYLKSTYGVTPEQFSALIYSITPYSIGERPPFLDRVMDGPGAGEAVALDKPLVLDGSELDLAKDSCGPALSSLCRAFALEDRVARDYLQRIAMATLSSDPLLSLSTCSSLYRLTRLPRLFKLNQTDGASLIALLAKGSPEVLDQLAGTPGIHDDPDQPDILDVLVGLVNLERWLRRQNISAHALLSWLTPLSDDATEHLKASLRVDANIKQTLSEALPRIESSLLSESQIRSVMKAQNITLGSGTWLDTLNVFLDEHGLVKTQTPEAKKQRVDTLGTLLKDTLANSSDTTVAASLLDDLLANAEVAQEDLVKHMIHTAFQQDNSGLTPDHVLPLLRWINESAFNVLLDVATAADKDKKTLAGLRPGLWSELSRHAQVIGRFRMSAAGLNALVDNPQWFDLEEKFPTTQDDSTGEASSTAPVLNLDLCYQLSCYRDWVATCTLNGFKEEDALDYLSSMTDSDQPAAAERLDALTVPSVDVKKEQPGVEAPKTFSDFLSTLTSDELEYAEQSGFGNVVWFFVLYHAHTQAGDFYDVISLDGGIKKFRNYLESTNNILRVIAEDYAFFQKKTVEYENTRVNRNPTQALVIVERYPPISAESESAPKDIERPSSPRTTSDIQPEAVEAAAEHLGRLIGWHKHDVLLAGPRITVPVEEPANDAPKTLDDFLNTLSVTERKYYDNLGLKQMIACYLWVQNSPYNNSTLRGLYEKFKSFITSYPAPIKVTKKQYESGNDSEKWEKFNQTRTNPLPPITLEIYLSETDTEPMYEEVPCVPCTISDIDFILRAKTLCTRTGLSCQSLLNLIWLDEASAFENFHSVSQSMLGGCDDVEREQFEPKQQEQWRDALVAYLNSHWVPTQPSLRALNTDINDLSSYFLTDLQVSAVVKTTTATQAVASLQHYLHRIFAHLEPGYETATLPEEDVEAWRQYLSEYSSWKQWRSKINHPENLIYYAHRPNKSKAFEELEVEINRGKLDTELLQAAITNYLTKFEKTSNLQVVSGYLDGIDPKNDKYHFVGKTNASPPEYYWRSLDMGLRDNQQRLSPLAWSEWEKIGIPVSGQITQSSYSGTDGVIKCDTIRPLMIAGRPYVFWVERASTGLPSADEKNQTPTKYKKLSVCYAYKQSDGFWSPINELLCLDGTKDGKRLPDKDNPYLKDDTYEPGLIAVVNVEGEREQDPWLTVMLYNCARVTDKTNTVENPGKPNIDYFVEIRDLLLIDKKSFGDSKKSKNFETVIYNTYIEATKIQHPYTGERMIVTLTNGYSSFGYGMPISATHSNKSLNVKIMYSPIICRTARSKNKSIEIYYPYKTKDATFIFECTKEDTDFSNGSSLPLTLKVRSEKCPPSLRCVTDQDDGPPESETLIPKNTGNEWRYDILIKTATSLVDQKFRLELDTSPPVKIPINVKPHPEDCETVELKLEAVPPNDSGQTIFSEIREVLADGSAVLTYDFPYSKPGKYDFTLSPLEGPMVLEASFELRETGVDQLWDISIKRNKEQAQYLDLSAVAKVDPIFTSNVFRLNTLFGKPLVARAAQSIDRALSWDSQLIKEPTIDSNFPTPTVDFYGANGGYFRELFLHLPAMVATRLSEAQQFQEAERWHTRYLFDPYRAAPDALQRPPFWNTRPLAEAGTGSSGLQKAIDPIALAFSLSRPYQQAMLLALMENWQRQGDHFYRQLTRSSLNHAWLSYQQALNLMGPLPERASVTRWVPVTLERIKTGSFRPPINERLTRARNTLQSRLFNLRHGLTIDGKVLPPMDWLSEGGDPFGFASGGVGSLASSYNSDRASIPAYRFRQLLPMVRTAVQQLLNMGRHYMKLMEDEFNTAFSVLLKQQEIRISDFTLRLKQEAINSVIAKRRTLEQSKQAAQYRKSHYDNLLQTGRSPIEEAATGLIWSSTTLKAMALPFQITAGIVKSSVPTIYGMAVGGIDPSAPMDKTAKTLEIAGDVSKFLSEQLLAEAGYERRAQEWRFELKQAELDIQAIDLVLAETNIELNASTISLQESSQERTNLDEAYVSMTTGFTIIPTYNWLVARQELLYGPAYDAVLSLCLSAEAAWRYEIGDYTRPAFIKTSAWNDAYKGMLAGESLLVDLLEMEDAYLRCNERRLSIKKTVDLKGAQTDAQWLATLKGLADKPLEFELKSRDFDKNYPGHYLRQLKHVSVSFVLTAGPGTELENLSAILTQTGSTTLAEANSEGADYLYGPVPETPACIKRNLRAQQQIALSSALADDGLGFPKSDWTYELMFDDGRYLPFEGTGAISRWQLSFPDVDLAKSLPGKDGKPVVKTILINMVYSAVDGGPAFTSKVKALMKSAK